jgi:hypothetical protein
MRLTSIAAALGILTALPAPALAAESTPTGTDRTMEIMIGLIVFLMAAMVVIAILEARKSH